MIRDGVIILDESPTKGPKRSFPTSSTVKLEPLHDISNISRTDGQERPTKKVKLESGFVTGSSSELVRLKHEDEVEEEELAAAQEVARLLKLRRERRARIAALEADNGE